MKIKLFAALSCFAALALLSVCSDNPSSGSDDNKKYTLTVKITPASSGEVTRSFGKDGTDYVAGTQINVIAKPKAGYAFAGWSGDLTSAKDTLKVVMDKDIALTATFKAAEVTPGDTAGTPPDSTVTPPDSTVTPPDSTVTPPDSAVTPPDSTVTPPDSTVTPPDSTVTPPDSTVTPSVFELTIDKNPASGGIVHRNPDQTAYPAGTKVELMATSADNYRFAGWSGALKSEENVVEVTMDTSKTLTANFVKQFTLTINVAPAGVVSAVTRDPELAKYDSGTVVTVTAEIPSGYAFTHWSGASDAPAISVQITMDSNKELVANFSPVQTQPYTLTVKSSPEGIFSSRTERHPNGTRVTIHEVAEVAYDGHIFIGWTDETGKVIQKSIDEFGVLIDKDKTLTAHYGKYTVTVEIENECEGSTVTITPDKKNFSKQLYYDNEEITTTAIPGPDCGFNGWAYTSDIDSRTYPKGLSNSQDWNVDRNLIIIPYFPSYESED